jgi:hypothetical protein
MRTRPSGGNGESSGVSGSNAPEPQTDRDGQAGPSTRSQANDGPPNSGEPPSILVTRALTRHKQTGDKHQPGGTPGDTTQSTRSEALPRMIGDFDDSANALWTLQMKEAKSHDEARIQSLKDDMDGVLIFVRVHISVVIFYS